MIKNLPNAPGSKRKRNSQPEEEDVQDDGPEARRLRARMEKAMEHGEEDSEDDEEEITSQDIDNVGIVDPDKGDEESEFAASFHTKSDDADEDVIDENDEDDEDERLEEGPIDEETRRMRARMQAAIEAAERRARGNAAATPPAKPAAKVIEDATDDAQYDLAPLRTKAKPLSASVLKAAAAADAEKKRKAEEAKKTQVVARKKRRRKQAEGRKGVQQVERKIS